MEEPDSLPEEAEPPRGLTLALTSLSGHILGMAVCGAGGAWLVMKALDAPGPTWSRVAFGGAGVLLAVGGVGLGVGGIRRFVRWMRSDEYGRNLEQRARKLGLPTEPEAYRDGGLAVAATAGTLEKADLIAITLRGAGIPAWVPDRATAGWYWHLQYAISPGGMRVMVPLGRLQDARHVLAEHGHQEPESAELAEHGDLSVTAPPTDADTTVAGEEAAQPEEEESAEDDPAEHLLHWCRAMMVILFISMTMTSPLVLPASVWVFAKAWDGYQKTGRKAFRRAMRWSAVTGAIALLMVLVLALLFVPMALDAMEPHLGPLPDDAKTVPRDMVLP